MKLIRSVAIGGYYWILMPIVNITIRHSTASEKKTIEKVVNNSLTAKYFKNRHIFRSLSRNIGSSMSYSADPTQRETVGGGDKFC